ncbi:hypothetical protein LJR260_003519 [Variovorax paradoxus]|uniref:hypothetical protein n=1 Tax=Variovorax paradoxus TaxID=34073 RepID=UPI003392DDD9
MASLHRIKRSKPLGFSDAAAGAAPPITVLLSDDLWPRVREAVGKLHDKNGDRPPILAAISYVTNDHLGLRAGDTLICDASKRCIEDGATSARLLRQIHNNGAQLRSFAGLHAKVAVIGPYSMVGSGNMTSNSERLLEAATWSTDSQIRGSVLELIRVTMAQPQAREINDEFLKRIEAIEVKRHPPVRRLNRARIDVGSELLGPLIPEDRASAAGRVRAPTVWMLTTSLEPVRTPPRPLPIDPKLAVVLGRNLMDELDAVVRGEAPPKAATPTGPRFRRAPPDRTSIKVDSPVASQLRVGDLVFPAVTGSSPKTHRPIKELIGTTRISRLERVDGMLICHFEPIVGRGTIKWPSVSKALQKAGLHVGDRPDNIELTRDAASALLRLSKTWSLPKS